MVESVQFGGVIRYWDPTRSSGLAVVDVPAELVPAFGGLKQVRVVGTINSSAFGSSVMPAGAGRLALSVSKAMMKTARVAVGDVAEFTVTKIGRD